MMPAEITSPSPWAKDFPILKQKVHGQDLIYFDNAATSQKPQLVLDRLADYYLQDNANIHRGVHSLANRATQDYEAARQRVADFMGAKPQEIIFTSGTTAGLNFLADRWIGPSLQPGDQIGVTYLEHHSNLVPWQALAQEKGATLRYLPLTEDHHLDLVALEASDWSKLKVITIHHVSNVLGISQDIVALTAWAKPRGIKVIVDGAQAVAHMPVDVGSLGVDAYCWSGHKLYGPTGIGICYLKQEYHDTCQPFFYGGEMVHQVGDYRTDYAVAPQKFEGGTPPIAQAIGLAAAIDWLTAIGWQDIETHESHLTLELVRGLQAIPGVEVYGHGHGIVTFNISGVHPHDAATAYDLEGIALRAGHHCAQPLMRRLGQAATLRASMALYNDAQEVARFIEVTKAVKEFFCP